MAGGEGSVVDLVVLVTSCVWRVVQPPLRFGAVVAPELPALALGAMVRGERKMTKA